MYPWNIVENCLSVCELLRERRKWGLDIGLNLIKGVLQAVPKLPQGERFSNHGDLRYF